MATFASKRKYIEFKCSDCGEHFTADDAKGIWYFEPDYHSTDKNVRYFCNKCIAKWKKSWQTKSITILPNSLADVVFKDGRKLQISYAELLGKFGNLNLDAPPEFWEELTLARKEHFEKEVKPNIITECQIIDTYGDHRLHIETEGGFCEDYLFEYGPQGERRFEPKIKTMPDYLKREMPALIYQNV